MAAGLNLVDQIFPHYSIPDAPFAEKKIHLITSDGSEKVILLDKRNDTSKRSLGSKLHYHDGASEYLSALIPYNLYPVGTFSDSYKMDNFSAYFEISKAPYRNATISRSVTINPKGASRWSNSIGWGAGNNTLNKNVAIMISSNDSYSVGLLKIEIDGVIVASLVTREGAQDALWYVANLNGVKSVVATATNVDMVNSYDFHLYINVIQTVS